MKVELAAIGKVKKINIINNSVRKIKAINKNIKFFLIKKHKNKDSLLEATKIHEVITKLLWQMKLQKYLNV